MAPLALLLACACSTDEAARVEATSNTGLTCQRAMSLSVDPSGDVAGYPNAEAALLALAEAEGFDTVGLTLTVMDALTRARGRWRTADGELVAEGVAEPLHDRGWYGTGLTRCTVVAGSEDG